MTTITITEHKSTRKQEGYHEPVYLVDTNEGRFVATTPRDLLLEVARCYHINIRELVLR